VSDAILVLNAGSSSIKFSLFPGHVQPTSVALFCEGACDGIGHRIDFTEKDGAGSALIDEHLPEGASHQDALAAVLCWPSLRSRR
jgi:acetate kinase